jgi:hypothetical protein
MVEGNPDNASAPVMLKITMLESEVLTVTAPLDNPCTTNSTNN